jgi:hypothetical protein
MTDLYIIIILVIGIVNFVLLLVLLNNNSSNRFIRLDTKLEAFEKGQDKLEISLKDEIGRFREEISFSGRNQFELVANQLSSLTKSNEHKLDKMREVLEEKIA